MNLSYYISVDTRPAAQTKSTKRDYRFGKLYLYDNITSTTLRTRKDKMLEPLRAKYLGDGVIKLFVKNEELETDHFSEGKNNAVTQPVRENNYMMAILSVPSYFTYNDLLEFIGERYTDTKTVIQIIKLADLNKFTVIIYFHDNETLSLQFQEEFNGKQFNSMNQDMCSVIKIDKLIISTPTDTHQNSKDGSATVCGVKNINDIRNDTDVYPESSNNFSSSILAKLSKDMKELPTCTVCLERMDSSVLGLIIIPCQHNFHCQCLSKWSDDTCPVCRYSSSIALKGSSLNSVLSDKSGNTALRSQDPCNESEICAECNTIENLWICLICGHIGCSRYDGAHALQHFKDSGHCFSMEMQSQRIWDYVGDIYVHRLIANSDGKLLELPDNDRTEIATVNNESYDDGYSGNRKSSNYTENLSNFVLSSSSNDKFTATKQLLGGRAYIEYSNILRSQLESQREYFEKKLNDSQTKYETKFSDMTETVSKLEILHDHFKRTEEELIKYKKMYNEEKIVDSNLMKRIEQLNRLNDGFKNKIQELNNEISELHEQNKDLMFYLETLQKLKDMPDDVKEGQIHISYPSNTNKKKAKKKKKEKHS